MTEQRFARLITLVGQENFDKLSKSKVLVFGVGGVGSYVCEALARSGVGTIDVVDSDKVAFSNINRQIIALESTVDKDKTTVVKDRLVDINPNIFVNEYKMFFLPENSNMIDFSKYDYIVDAVDTVTAKLEIVKCAQRENVPVISCMGTGNKLDPTKLVISDIYKTKVCPLARAMRLLCKNNGIKKLCVVYSEEQPKKSQMFDENNGKPIPSSSAFVPSCAGLIIASKVVRDICNL